MRSLLNHRQGGVRTGLVVSLLSLAGAFIVSAQTTAAAPGVNGLAAVHRQIWRAALRPRPGRGRVRTDWRRLDHRYRGRVAVHVLAAQRPLRWKRRRVEGPGTRAPSAVLATVSGESPDSGRATWHGDVSAATFARSPANGLRSSKATRTETQSTTTGPGFVRTRTEEESLAQLLSGAVNYTLMDELVVRYLTSNYPKEAQSRLQFGGHAARDSATVSRDPERSA